MSRCLAGLFVLALVGLPEAADNSSPPVDLSTVFSASRISDAHYRLVLYRQDGVAISNQSMLDREIAREAYEGRPAIRITEVHTQGDTSTKTVAFVDAKTLAPLYVESSTGGRMTQKASFDKDRQTVVDFDNGAERTTETTVPASVYLSNSFSELIQAVDFGRHPAVRFETVSPGNQPNRFIAAREGEHAFEVSPRLTVDTWLVRFTRVDGSGKETSAGFRYVEKASGKVLMFKSALDSSKFFTYQMLLAR